MGSSESQGDVWTAAKPLIRRLRGQPMKRFTVFCLIPMLAAACATSPVTLTDAKPVPADRVFAYSQARSGPSGTVVIVRDAGHMGGGCPLALYLDGALAAHVRASETVTLTVPAGNHIFGAGPAGSGMCSWRDESAHRRETSQEIKENSTIKIRLAMTQEGVIQITPTGF